MLGKIILGYFAFAAGSLVLVFLGALIFKKFNFLEKFLWGHSLLAFITIAVCFFIGQRSYIQEGDIQIKRVNTTKLQKVDWDVLEKYLSKAELEQLKQQEEIRKKQQARNANRRRVSKRPPNKAKPGDPAYKKYYNRFSQYDGVVEEAGTDSVLPNTSVRVVSQDFKEKYASSFQEVMQLAKQAGSRFVRTKDGPRPQIIWINPGSLIHRMGFRPGDVLMKVNSKPVSSIQEGRNIYNQLKGGKNFLVQVRRNGVAHRFIYRIGN